MLQQSVVTVQVILKAYGILALFTGSKCWICESQTFSLSP